MNYDIVKKANRFAEQLEAERASRTYMSSPVHYVLWRFGVNLRPPIIAGFWQNFVIQGGIFALMFTIISLLLALTGFSEPIGPLGVLIAGMVYGLFMAYFTRRHYKKLIARGTPIPEW